MKRDNTYIIIPDHFNFEKITTSEGFASRVMDRIQTEKSETFLSLRAGTKVMLAVLIFAIYSSVGILLGIQGHKNKSMNLSDSRRRAINELRDIHHLNTISRFDDLLKPF
jgi:hypothetical protein